MTFSEDVEGGGDDKGEGDDDQNPYKPGVRSNYCKIMRDLLQYYYNEFKDFITK